TRAWSIRPLMNSAIRTTPARSDTAAPTAWPGVPAPRMSTTPPHEVSQYPALIFFACQNSYTFPVDRSMTTIAPSVLGFGSACEGIGTGPLSNWHLPHGLVHFTRAFGVKASASKIGTPLL